MQISRLLRYGILVVAMAVIPASSFAGVFISVGIAPPALPVYVQPACPGDGYIWTPGYWAYGPDGYYWVPGTWVLAPEPGLLWTPGYWGWGGSAYIWHAGYWGPHVGFYGGVNYGFGYFGSGFSGGYWHDRTFYYNRSVSNVTITNVHIYNRTVVNNVTVNRVSYNGGRGGVNMRPTREQERWDHERHFEATHTQMDHENSARGNREFLASVNHGRPGIAATARPGDFHGRDVAPARGPDRPEGRPMGHDVPRPNNAGRSMERPAPHQDAMAARGGRQNQEFHPDNHPQPRSNVAPRPNTYHGGGQPGGGGHADAPRGNGGPHGDAPHGNAGPHGGGQQHGGGEGHGHK